MRLQNIGDQLELSAELDGPSFASGNPSPTFLAFSSHRRAAGARLAVLAVLSLAGGLAIVSQVHLSSTIGWLLLIDCYIVAALLLMGAALVGIHALRNLAGGVSMDQNGLRLNPLFFRKPIAWSDVHEWEARQISNLRLLRIHYRASGKDQSLLLSSQWLSDESLRRIERELRRHMA